MKGDRIDEINALLERLSQLIREEHDGFRAELDQLRREVDAIKGAVAVDGAALRQSAPVEEEPETEMAPEKEPEMSLESFYDKERNARKDNAEREVHAATHTAEASWPSKAAERQGKAPETSERHAPNMFSIDDSDSFFEVMDTPRSATPRKRVLGELFSEPDSIAKLAQKSTAWETDIPGPKVDSVEEAISINDRMVFINDLFGGDEDQYDLTMERINETNSFREVVFEMRSAFPEWIESSDDVYRFYMAVRRKFREE